MKECHKAIWSAHALELKTLDLTPVALSFYKDC